ncbi:hypothetical protein [Clostridium sp.]
MKKLLIIIVPITLFLTFYFWNYDFNIFIRSKGFSQHNHIVSYLDSREIDIPLPANSVWLFETPHDIYYSEYDVNKCRTLEETIY